MASLYVITFALLLPLVFLSLHEPSLGPRSEWQHQLIRGTDYISIRNLSVDELSESLNNGSFTSQTLVQVYLARIAEVNPTIHSVTETNPDALEIARELDRERAQSGPRR